MWPHQHSLQHLACFPLPRGQTLRHKRNQSCLSWPTHRLPVQVFAAGLPAGGRVACSSALTSPGGGQARPAGTQQGLLRLHCTPRSCQSAFPGTLGSGNESCKKDPWGTEEAVKQTPNSAAQACPRQPARACLPDVPHSKPMNPCASQKCTSPLTCKPLHVFLPFSPGTPRTESRHPDNSPC